MSSKTLKFGCDILSHPESDKIASRTDAQGDAFRMGNRLNIGPDLEIEITGERKYQNSGLVKNEVMLEGSLKW